MKQNENEIEAQSGQKVRVTSVPSDLAQKLHGEEESEYEATLLGVETIGGHVGTSEQEKIAVETEDGETEHISMGAWNNDPEAGETGVSVVSETSEESQPDDDNDDDDDDVRTDNMKIEMAEHFLEFQAEYRTEPQHHEVVYEDDQVIVVADHTGHELNEWASDFGFDRSELSETMHMLARQLTDYSWSASDPVVFDKLEDRKDEYGGGDE